MRLPASPRILVGAAVLSIAAVGLMVWSLFDPTPVPVVAAMSIGQALGTLSLASFLLVVWRDLRAGR